VQNLILRCSLLFVVSSLGAFAPAQRHGGKVEPGPWTPQKVPEGWVLHETKNYQVQSQAGLEKARRLGEHMEVMNRVYRNLFKPDKDGAKRQVIKLLENRKAYLAYGAPASSAAYYSRSEREMVCYDTGKWSDEAAIAVPTTGTGEESAGKKESALERRMRRMDELMKMDILGCAAHEGWHQYFDWLVVSFVTLPSWINEGLGDYFYTAAPKSNGTRSRPAELGQLNHGRLMILKAAIAQGRFVPLRQLLSMSKGEFYANAGVCYAEGWAFCQFLLHSGNPKYSKVIPAFVRTVRDDTNMESVTAKVFKGLDMEKMEAEFQQWVGTLKLPVEEEQDPDPKEAGPGEAGKEPGTPPVPQGEPPPGGTGGPGGGGIRAHG